MPLHNAKHLFVRNLDSICCPIVNCDQTPNFVLFQTAQLRYAFCMQSADPPLQPNLDSSGL
jgi:hypothetical protein